MGMDGEHGTGLTWSRLADQVDDEVARARRLFPSRELRLLSFHEEAGELTKAVLDHMAMEGEAGSSETLDDVREELVQAMAMLVRLWEEGDSSLSLPGMEGDE